MKRIIPNPRQRHADPKQVLAALGLKLDLAWQRNGDQNTLACTVTGPALDDLSPAETESLLAAARQVLQPAAGSRS